MQLIEIKLSLQETGEIGINISTAPGLMNQKIHVIGLLEVAKDLILRPPKEERSQVIPAAFIPRGRG
jgi:hypothetical protein